MANIPYIQPIEVVLISSYTSTSILDNSNDQVDRLEISDISKLSCKNCDQVCTYTAWLKIKCALLIIPVIIDSRK